MATVLPEFSNDQEPPDSTAHSWNSSAGWSTYFPNDSETDPASVGRAKLVSVLYKYFSSSNGVHLLKTPQCSFTLPLDYTAMAVPSAPGPLRSAANVLRNNPLETIASIGLAACRAAETLAPNDAHLSHWRQVAVSLSTRIIPRISNFSPPTSLRNLRSSSVGKFVAVRGTVVRVSPIRQQLVSMQFQCSRCAALQNLSFNDYKYAVPASCPTDRCRSRSFLPQRDTALTVDWQRIRIQELHQRDDAQHEAVEEGRMPRTVDVELLSDLIDSCVPGDVATVCGIVKLLTVEGGGGPRNAKCLYYVYVEANSVTTARRRSNEPGAADEAQVFNEDTLTVHRVVQEVVKEKDPFAFLVKSAVPSIYGHELVKAGLLLALFGGSDLQRVDDGAAASGSDSADARISDGKADTNERVAIRRDIHCLIVGDPGLGKSQMLKAMSLIAPRGVYVCGNTTSTAGLTVTVVRDAEGDFALEAGALVLADRGVCCIDEFDKMGAEHGSLLEAMEQQSVSVAKAGLLCNLSARTTVLAAANPVGGHYDRAHTVCENLKIPMPLLSRFDLVFILQDRADRERDRFISDHVMSMFGGRASEGCRDDGTRHATWRRANRAPSATLGDVAAETAAARAATQARAVQRDGGARARRSLEARLREARVADPLPPSLFRGYVEYARQHAHPTLSAGAKRVLQEFYLGLRRAAKTLAADTTPVTTRQLESVVRLSQARARAVMRTVVTADDAGDVVEIMRECMRAEVTDEHGVLDFGRASGMSRSAEARKFVKRVAAEAERKRCALFSKDELKRLAQGIGADMERFSSMIDTINHQGFLIKKGNGRYELQGSDYAGQAARHSGDSETRHTQRNGWGNENGSLGNGGRIGGKRQRRSTQGSQPGPAQKRGVIRGNRGSFVDESGDEYEDDDDY